MIFLRLIAICLILPRITVAQWSPNSIQAPLTKSEHEPVLQVSSLVGYLPETAKMGDTVKISPSLSSESLQILVNDDDLKPGMPPATYQYILTGLGARIFAVDQRGYVYLNVNEIDADHPNPSTYELNVQAREVDTDPILSSKPVTITIHIMDDNDNAPQFEHAIYTASTSASGGERPIVMVSASDLDSGAYGTLTYRIAQVTNNAESLFYYDTATHMLFATGQLQAGERYQVVIEATDGGGKSSQAIVVVLAADGDQQLTEAPPLPGMETFRPHPNYAALTANTVATQAPQVGSTSGEQDETIQTFVTEVSENTPANTVVVILGAEVANDQIYFSIAGGNEEGKFTIDPQSGAIKTVSDLDRERTAMYSLQIETRSKQPDQHLYWTLVQISVLDVNDNSPHFVGPQPIMLSKSIDDLDELGTNLQIGRVEVEDLDADDNGRVQLKVAPPMNKLFTVSSNGMLSVNGDFSASHFGEHRLIITASDHGDPPRETKGEVHVNIYGTLITMATVAPTNEIFEYTTSSEEDPESPTLVTLPPGIGNSVFSSFPSPIPETATLRPLFPSVQLPPKEETSAEYYSTEEQPATSAESQTTVVQTRPETRPPIRTTYPSTTTTPWLMTTTTPVRTTSTTTTRLTTTRPATPRTTQTVPPTMPIMPPVQTTPYQPQVPKRLAPVFHPAQLVAHVEENKAEVEIAKVHASYPDGGFGTISYVLKKGDENLFAVSSFSGSVTLLRPLDAEVDTSYVIEISTVEASQLATDASQPHSTQLTIHVDDANDWIPAFEQSSYHFNVNEDTSPGSILGQVQAFDQDRDEPNNRVRFRLISAGGLESHFSVDQDTGIITLARPIDAFSGEKITLKVEATDGGSSPLSSQTSVLIDVMPTSSQVIPESNTFSRRPTEGQLQFSLRNYTASVSESVRPPHLVQVLSVANKPADTRFIICNIVSGNYRGAFGVVAGNDGNCELRTQMELDRESVERYLLNITVTSGSQTDYALVYVTVLDVNDNVPRFIYDDDLGLSAYFAGVSSSAGAFSRVLTVKAEDADLGNSSVVKYALDPRSVHSKYFSISPFGEISTKQSMQQILQKQRLNYFELLVSACDSPISGQQLCSKTEVIINVITEQHRFRMITAGLNPQQLTTHQEDITKSIRQFTGACSLVNMEKMVEVSTFDNQVKTDIYWYAVNPTTKKICKKNDFTKLFESSSVQMLAGKVQPWFRLERLSEDDDTPQDGPASMFPGSLRSTSLALLAIAAAIALLATIAIIAVCCFYRKYKISQREMQAYNPHSFRPQTKMGPAIYLPQPPYDPRIDSKIYETQSANHNFQMCELGISDEETLKSGSMGATQPRGLSYRNYGRQPSMGYEGDFSIEESMYAINVPGRVDSITKRIQTLVIPSPDYPPTSNNNNQYYNKSLL